MGLRDYSAFVVHGFEIAGIAVIVVGSAVATVAFLVASRRVPEGYRTYRQRLGKAILLGLELLVAADIINTVGVDPTLRTVAVLAGVVLIRTFLSFSLEVEIEGRWPWKRALARPDALSHSDARLRRRVTASSEDRARRSNLDRDHGQ